MQVLKAKWKNYRSYKKVQSLWQEYKKVSHLRDNPETLKKFELFIDTMQGYLREMASKNPANSQAENVFGHCSEIMSSMIQFLNQYRETSEGVKRKDTEQLNELLAKVLEIIEYILKDPKYRKEIQNSPILLQNFVDLIETVDQGESSTFLIKIIILMSENVETKIEFGKKQGFKKLFDLLEKKDEKTSNLILTALIHFLDLKQSKTYSQNTARLLQELDALSLNKKEETSTVSNKLKNIAVELRKVVFGEFDRVFQNTSGQVLRERKASLVDSPRHKDSHEDTTDTLYEHLPSYEAILAFDLSQVHKDLNLIPSEYNTSRITQAMPEKEENILSHQGDTVKDFIVDQGALVALSNSLKEPQNEEGDFILVSLDTLQQLLSGNKKSREEFKKVNGYSSLSQIFFKTRDYNEPKNIQFLESALSALKGFILDNNKVSVIQDYDAYQILLSIISGHEDLTVISHALMCLSAILKMDWKNIIFTVRMNGFSHLAHLIWRVSRSKALSPESFTIGLLSIFTKLNEGIQTSDIKRMAILEKTAEIFRMLSVVLGVLNIDAEIIFAEFAESHLLQNDELVSYFLENLLSLMETKISNVCASIITLDYHLDAFIKTITNIFNLLVASCLRESSLKYKSYLNRILILAERILRCDHTHDILKDKERSSSGDLSQSNSTIEEFQNMERRSPFKVTAPQFEFKIVCKNLCAEIKSYISYKFGEALLNEKPQLKSIFTMLDYKNSSDPEVFQKNLLILRILKCLLIANSKLMDTFEKLNGSTLWMGMVLRLYENSGSNNQYLVEMLSFLFDIVLNRNNVFSVLKCYSTRNLEAIPVICPERKQYLSVIEDILLKSKFDDEVADVFDIINGLLNQNENMNTFKENGGLNFLFNVMLSLRSITNNFYTQTLTIFEQLITKFQPEDVDLFFETFFHTDFLRMCSQNNLHTLFIDLLSFLSIHVALHTNPVIIERIISQEHYIDLIGLLDSTHTGVLDMTLKFLNVIFTSSSKVKKNTLSHKSKFIPLFIEMMKNVEPAQDLIQSVFELIFNNMDNIDILYPPNTSTVSSILNRSVTADLIIQNSKKDKSGKAKAIPNLASFEFLEIFVYLLSKCKDENLLYAFWKQFSEYLDSSNMDKLLDSNFVIWVAHFLSPFDISKPFLPKFIEEVLSILAKVLNYDLSKQKNSKIIEVLKKIEDEETLVNLIICKLLERVARNPIVKDENAIFLKNLAHFFVNLEDIIGMKPEVLTYMLHCINLLASRSTGEIRSAMKTQNLFEFRDNLLMQLLKFNLKSTSLYNIMKDFSFKALANQSKFRDAHIIAYLVRILLQNADYLNLQLLILRILKEDIAINDENVKYVTKIIDTPTLLLYLYPNYKQKSSGVIKCFSSVINCENRPGSDSNTVISTITPETSNEDFLKYLNSDQMEGERKQILLKINMMLIPVENDLNKNEMKI